VLRQQAIAPEQVHRGGARRIDSLTFRQLGTHVIDALAKLVAVMPPPKRPLYSDGNWEAVEKAIGLLLPADYKAFIETYGSGMVNGCLDIQSPLRPGEDIRQWWTIWAELYSDIAEYIQIPYPVFPQPEGLLPFGTLGDVDFLNWLTIGEPDHWPFVYYDREQGFIESKACHVSHSC